MYLNYYAYFLKYMLIKIMNIIIRVSVTNHPFEDLLSECNCGATVVRHGQVYKRHSCTRL